MYMMSRSVENGMGIEGDTDRENDTINKLDNWSVEEAAIGRLVVVVYRLCLSESIAGKGCRGFIS